MPKTILGERTSALPGAPHPILANLGAYLLLAPALLLFGIFIVYPMINSIIASFYTFSLTNPNRVFIGLQNYRELLADRIFWLALRNNVVILIGSVAVQVTAGLVLAALLNRGIERGKTIFRTIIFAPMVMSVVAVGILWQLIFNPSFGLLNRFIGLFGVRGPRLGWLGDPDLVIYSILAVASWQYTGFMMVILLAGMQSIPGELYEAAKLDGATEVQSFRFITVPGIRNVLIAATLITMIGAFKIFDLIYVLTLGGPANSSQVLGTYIYQSAFTLSRMGYASAIAVILLVFAIVLGIAQLRLSHSSTRGR